MRLGKKGEFVGFTLLALLVMGLFFVSFGDLKISGYAVYSGDGDCGSYVNESSTLSGNINCNNTGLFINANNIELDCQGYNITYNLNGTDDKYGIYNYQFDNVTIKNCGVIEGNSSGNNSYGIYYYDQTDNGTILNNSITIESVNADGIRVYTSTNHEILNNTLVANGNNSAGIFIGRSNENEVYNNNITINNSNGKGIYVYRDSHNNTFNQNTINDNGNGAKGFLIYDGGTPCLNNILMNNSITVDGLDLDIVGGNNDTWLIDQIISNYSIQPGATININNSWGIIEFSDLIEVVGNNLSGDIQISNNSIYVNSSNSGLNRSAELTFYNITGITNPIPYRNNEKCEDAICTGFTNLGNWTYSFNVASWSNYSIEEDIINCGKYVNNNLILTGNLNCEGTGLFINDSDVEIDCNGSNIQFGNSGDNYSAIENIGFNNITNMQFRKDNDTSFSLQSYTPSINSSTTKTALVWFGGQNTVGTGYSGFVRVKGGTTAEISFNAEL